VTKDSTAESSTPRVLVVDDEATICTFVSRVLTQGGYEVIAANDGPMALEIVATQGLFDVFVIDIGMPEMSGDEVARRLRSLHPDAKVLYFTGDSDRLFNEKKTLWEHEAFLDKPVSKQELLQAVALLLYGSIHRPT
jgi:two-component system cell cycle sensor histidine kinase/response regulator CckA